MTWMRLMLLVALCGSAQGELTLRYTHAKVVTEEPVYTFEPANNGSGPLWSFGCSPLLRMGDTVVLSKMETGPDVPGLSNTRWVLMKRTETGWEEMAGAGLYRQREPAVLAMTSPADLFLNVNDSLEPVGAHYKTCRPYLIHFELGKREAAGLPLFPQWADSPYFTDHSYRGYAADPSRGELLMLNIDAKTGIQHAALMNTRGETVATGQIEFPIRACYPQVSLSKGAARVLAIGDIVEPVEEWRQYKKEQTGREWDYVFLVLYYAETLDLSTQNFGPPLEIANVNETGGHITNKDLWVSPEGDAYILYTEREVQSAMLRDKFFPDKSVTDSLYLAIVRNGAVASREVLVRGTESRYPGEARFHEAPDGHLLVFYYLHGEGGGHKLQQVLPWNTAPPVEVPLERLGSAFLLSNTRAGAAPGTTIDALGAGAGNEMIYARIDLETLPAAAGVSSHEKLHTAGTVQKTAQ